MTSQQDEMRRQLNNAYIESKLSGILEPMVGQLLKDQPPNYVSQQSVLPVYRIPRTSNFWGDPQLSNILIPNIANCIIDRLHDQLHQESLRQ